MRRISGNGLIVVVFAILLFLQGATPAAAEPFTDAEKAEVEAIVGEYLKANPEFIGDYLRRNPEILVEVSRILKERAARADREAQAAAMEARREELERHPMTPVSGNPDGDVTLVEFFDYNCGYCKRAFAAMKEIEAEDPNLRVVWKEYPILVRGTPTSLTAAQAAMAADRQGKYNAFHDALMSVRGPLKTDAQVFGIAADIGLDVARLKKDMKDPALRAYLQETVNLGGVLKFQGTPTFVIDGAVIGGALPKEYLVATIAAARAGELKTGLLSEEDLADIFLKFGS